MPIEIEKFSFIFFNIGTYFKIIANGDFFFKFASSLGEFVEECTQVIFTLNRKVPY